MASDSQSYSDILNHYFFIYNVFDRLEKDENCNILCDDLLAFLDFQTRPVFSLTEEEYQKIVRHAPPVKDTEVNYYVYNF